MVNKIISLALLVSGIQLSYAYALEDTNSPLRVSGGIAMPATSTAVFTNPAGMVAASTSLVLEAGAPEFWDSGTYRAGLQTGGPSFGLAVGVEDRDRTRNDSVLAYYGLAVGVPTFSLGLGGRTGLSNSSGTSLHAGALFNMGSTAHIGLTARGLDDGVSEWGAGVGFEVGSGVDLVIDAAADDDLKNPEVKPGIKVTGGPAALTLSYGTDSRQQFADGFTAGGSFQFSGGNLLEVQYNAGGELSKYFACLTLRL